MGDPGDPGAAGLSTGTISGTVNDAAGDPIAGATLAVDPGTTTATTDATGAFTMADVPIGLYTLTASATNYNDAALAGVGVASGLETLTSLQMSWATGAEGTVTGTVTNTNGAPIEGATVTLSGTTLSAMTDASGNYSIANAPAPGPYYIDVTAPAGGTYLDGGTRESLRIDGPMASPEEDIMLSARAPDDATYVGRAVCAGCHADQAGEHAGSAHWRSLTPDTSRMIETATMWPSVGGTIDTLHQARAPASTSGALVEVYFCQNTADAYAMKFGGAADCTVSDGELVPVAGTYGGEGDGGIDNVPNLGVHKQRFFAALADVPAADPWVYTSGKDRDYLILPVQVTQSGDNPPSYGGYHTGNWNDRSRTFSRKCAGCHATGMQISWNNDTDGFITAFDYINLNVACERCHGPGSAHAGSGGGLANQIIMPEVLTAEAENQLCGQCHAADEGHSSVPSTFGYAWNNTHAGDLGGGVFVPGVYDINDFIGNLATDGFASWPDGKHARGHRQQYSEFEQSLMNNNPFERLACPSCHSPHSLQQGPDDVEEGGYNFTETLSLINNVRCLSCHATEGPFESLTTSAVAAVHIAGGGVVSYEGADLSFTAAETAAAQAEVADAVVRHMNHEANMGLFVEYDPAGDPGVGRCANCHMPRTAKSGGWTTGPDQFGNSAMVGGDQFSHRFDIVSPQVSEAMVPAAGGTDTEVMPNSCSRCHARYRYSAD